MISLIDDANFLQEIIAIPSEFLSAKCILQNSAFTLTIQCVWATNARANPVILKRQGLALGDRHYYCEVIYMNICTPVYCSSLWSYPSCSTHN